MIDNETDKVPADPAQYRAKHRLNGLYWERSGQVLATDFDYDEIDKELGWEESPLPGAIELSDRQKRFLYQKLNTLFHYIAESRTIHSAGCRILAWTWLFNPDSLQQHSLKDVAESRGAVKQELHRYLRQLEVVSPSMKGRTSFSDKGRKSIKKAYHEKRKAGSNVSASEPAKELTQPTTEGNNDV